MKIDYSNTGIGRKDITFFGGAVPVLREVENNFHIPEVTERCLGKRVAQAKYSNYDCFRSFILSLLFNEGGGRILKVEKTKEENKNFKQLKIGSHDTTGRFMKKFATANKIHVRKNKKKPREKPKAYVVNENEQMIRFLIEAAIAAGLLVPGVFYTLDIDATFLRNKGKESKWTYKKHKGYTAMVATIGNIVVSNSLRSGNSSPQFLQLEALQNCIELLREYGIIVARTRIDGAGYTNKVLDYLDSEGIKFNVNAMASPRTHDMVMESGKWKKKPFKTSSENWKDAQFCSIPFGLSKSKKTYRLITVRTKYKMLKKDDEEINIDERKFNYKYTITNDYEITPHKLVQEYHGRGNAENNFRNLKQYFGWNILPFSKLNENHVYLAMTAVCYNLYQALLSKFSKLSKIIGKNIELKSFRVIFSSVRCKVTKGGKFVFSNFKVELEAIFHVTRAG